MKKLTLLVSIIILAFGITGCYSTGNYYGPSNALSLGAVGGLAGALLHDDKGKGAAIGGILGYGLGNEFDKARMGYQTPPPQYQNYQPQQSYSSGYQYGNAGVKGAYHKGRSDYFRKLQRDAERHAREIGRSGW